MATEAEERERLRYLQLKAKAAQASVEEVPELSGMDTTRGAIETFNQGTTLGFGDEIAGAIRTGIDALTPTYDFGEGVSRERPSLGETYEMYRDEQRDVRKDFEEVNPGTALALEVAGAIASPANLVAPGLGAKGSTGARLLGSVGRAGTEGALYGIGAAEDDLTGGALTGGGTGAGTALALTGGGGVLGRALSKSRIGQRLRDAAGNFRPIHLADPEGTLGQLYRSVVGGAYGGRGALGRQESRYLNRNPKLARFADEGEDLVEEAVGTASEINRVKGSIDDAAKVAKDTARRRVDDLRDVAKNADELGIEDLNRNALRRSVPEEYADNITEIGTAGQKQAKEAIESAYGSAWGNSTVSPVTKGEVGEILEETMDLLTKKERRALQAAIGDLDVGQSAKTVDRQLRELLNAKTSNPMARAIQRVRGALRSGLPEEAQDLLRRTDDVYPNYLATLRASASQGANARNGVFNAKELASGAKSASGWRQAGVGESELLEYARPLVRSARQTKEQAQRGVRLEQAKARRAGQQAEAAKNRLDRATKGILPETNTAWSQAAATALLGSPFTLVGGIGALPMGAAVARGLASERAQLAVAGQLPLQEALARALREGNTALATRIASRLAAQQTTGD